MERSNGTGARARWVAATPLPAQEPVPTPEAVFGLVYRHWLAAGAAAQIAMRRWAASKGAAGAHASAGRVGRVAEPHAAIAPLPAEPRVQAAGDPVTSNTGMPRDDPSPRVRSHRRGWAPSRPRAVAVAGGDSVATWEAVAAALRAGDAAAAESALNRLAAHSDVRTRDAARLARAQLWLSAGQASPARESSRISPPPARRPRSARVRATRSRRVHESCSQRSLRPHREPISREGTQMTRDKRVGWFMLAVATSAAWVGLACTTRLLHFPGGTGGAGAGSGSALDCPAESGWLTASEPVNLAEPPAHPQTECAFYQDAVQYFLAATQPPVDGGDPALASYATIDDTFTRAQPLAAGALAPAAVHRGTAQRAWLGYVKQPGMDSILIDQSGHAVYYGIHLDAGFVGFVTAQRLQTVAAIQHADPNLAFPANVAAFRSAWIDADPADGVTDVLSRFITTQAWVSSLHADPASGTISEDRDHPRQIRVALVALDVAFGLPGHPELVWATFQHVGADGSSDVAPISSSQATRDLGPDAVSDVSTLLYHAGTPPEQSNRPDLDNQLQLDETAQRFAQTTSVYRMFPASNSITTKEREEVTVLNGNVAALFSHLASADPRAAYRVMGAIWTDKPATFGVDQPLQNALSSPFVTGDHVDQEGKPAGPVPAATFTDSLIQYGTDSPYSILGGQDRLSNPAIESFTQAPSNFNNCLTCHNTQAVSTGGVPGPRDSRPTVLAPKLLNVSRVFSQFLIEECGPSGVCPAP